VVTPATHGHCATTLHERWADPSTPVAPARAACICYLHALRTTFSRIPCLLYVTYLLRVGGLFTCCCRPSRTWFPCRLHAAHPFCHLQLPFVLPPTTAGFCCRTCSLPVAATGLRAPPPARWFAYARIRVFPTADTHVYWCVREPPVCCSCLPTPLPADVYRYARSDVTSYLPLVFPRLLIYRAARVSGAVRCCFGRLYGCLPGLPTFTTRTRALPLRCVRSFTPAVTRLPPRLLNFHLPLRVTTPALLPPPTPRLLFCANVAVSHTALPAFRAERLGTPRLITFAAFTRRCIYSTCTVAACVGDYVLVTGRLPIAHLHRLPLFLLPSTWPASMVYYLVLLHVSHTCYYTFYHTPLYRYR